MNMKLMLECIALEWNAQQSQIERPPKDADIAVLAWVQYSFDLTSIPLS
ncbi:hypothetical protein [Nostoc sp.]